MNSNKFLVEKAWGVAIDDNHFSGLSSLNISRTWILNDLYVIGGYRLNGLRRQLIDVADG